MTSSQLAKFIAKCEEDAAILRKAQAIIARHAQRQARATMPAKLRQAQQLRAPAPEYKNGTEHVLALAEQWERQGTPITNRGLREAGVNLSVSGIGAALERGGYKVKGRIWSRRKKRATAKPARRNGPVRKGDATQTLVAVLRDAGQPMRIGDLLASVKNAGGHCTPQTVGSALRHHLIVRSGERGPNALYGLPT